MGSSDGEGRRSIELLAPAGDERAATAALANGADAVYLGLGELNARRNADNLTIEGLERTCRLAHLGGQRIYLTLNTAVLDREMGGALRLAHDAWEAGVDAAIVQDLGLLDQLHRRIPQLALHASTQMGIHDEHGVRLATELGAVRVTLARELALEEVARLAGLGVEVEVFGHGALCVCYSGQCLMSSLVGRRSANRGLCAQACRMPYLMVDETGTPVVDPHETGRYLLSPKDLCSIGLIGRLIGAGVASLKVEGRMKSPEYVACVTRVYRGAIDRALAGGDPTPGKGELDDLFEAFSRGFTTAYLEGDRSMRMMGPKRPNNRGLRVGRVDSLGGGLVTLALDREVRVGDVLEYWTARGAVDERVSQLLIAGRPVDVAPAGSHPRLRVSRPVAPADRVFRVQNVRLAREASASCEGFVGQPREVRVTVDCRLGRPLAVTLADAAGHVGSAEGPVVEAARTKALTAEDVTEHVGRFGGTPFSPVEWDVRLDEGCGMGFSTLHRVRAAAVEDLERSILAPYEGRREEGTADAGTGDAGDAGCSPDGDAPRRQPATEGPQGRFAGGEGAPYRRSRGAGTAPARYAGRLPLVTVLVSGENAAAIARALKPSLAAGRMRVEVPAYEALLEGERYPALGELLGSGATLFLPAVCHDGADQRVMGLATADTTVVADGLGTFASARELGLETAVGPHVPVWNAASLSVAERLGARAVWLSPELSLPQIADLSRETDLPLGLTVAGRQEAMVTEHCELMSIGLCSQHCATCPRRRGRLMLEDRMGYRFPVTTDPSGRGHVYNAVSLDLAPQVPDLLAAGIRMLRIDATLMDADEALRRIRRVTEAVGAARMGTEPPRKLEGTTTGHLFRSVL